MTRPAAAAPARAESDQILNPEKAIQPSCGVIITKTPIKPIRTADQRLMPTVSFKKRMAKMVMNMVFEKPMAVASDKGRWMKAEKPSVMARVAKITRKICKSGRLVMSEPGNPRMTRGDASNIIPSWRKNRISKIDMRSPIVLMMVTEMENIQAAKSIHRPPLTFPSCCCHQTSKGNLDKGGGEASI